MSLTGVLLTNEAHPAAHIALDWIKSNFTMEELLVWEEAFASTALSGDRMADICGETLRRLVKNEGVSDRYLLGLAWVMMCMKERL